MYIELRVCNEHIKRDNLETYSGLASKLFVKLGITSELNPNIIPKTSVSVEWEIRLYKFPLK